MLKDELLMQETAKEEEKEKEEAEKRKTKAAQKETSTTKIRRKTKSPSAVLKDRRLGWTINGERMLGIQPTEITSQVTNETCMVKCMLLAEKKGEKNLMIFEDSVIIGQKATNGYLKELPESDHNDIRTEKKKYRPIDKKGSVRIKAVAIKPGYSSKVYP